MLWRARRGGAGQEAGRGGYKYRSVWSSLPTAWGAGPGANREAVFLLTGKQAPCVCGGQTGPQTGSLEPASLPAAAKRQPQPGSPSWGVVLGALPMGGGTRGPEETLHLGSGGSPHSLPRPQRASLPGAMVVPHLPPGLPTPLGSLPPGLDKGALGPRTADCGLLSGPPASHAPQASRTP